MRKDEEHCKYEFDIFLKQRPPYYEITWIDGDEPPDYYLQLNGNKYAVEVTQIWDEIQINGNLASELGFSIAVMRFLKRLEEKAIEQGILSGAYTVDFKPIDSFNKQKKQIENGIIKFIRETKDNFSTQQCELPTGEDGRAWNITKRHSERKYISGMTIDFKWGQPLEELYSLLNKSLKRKTERMKNINLSKVLLLYDKYPWIDSSKWKQCLPQLGCIDNFHTIFLISTKSSNAVLHTVNSAWLN